MPVFKFAKEHSLGQNFHEIFYNYLEQNDTNVFTTEEKYFNGKKDNITYVVDWESKFRFLDDEISNTGKYCVDHYISERFYSLLLNIILT